MIEKTNKPFQITDHKLDARLARLSLGQMGQLETVLTKLSEADFILERPEKEREALPIFLLPLAEFGLTCDQMHKLIEKIPTDFILSHREIYFDYRMNRWIKHIEPLSILECMEDYFVNSESPDEALEYLKTQWQVFLKRNMPLARERASWTKA